MRNWLISSCSSSSSASPNNSWLGAWSKAKTYWIQLIWHFRNRRCCLLRPAGQCLAKEAKVEPWIRKDFAKRTGLAVRQLDVDEHFGLWLPTRRGCIGGVHLMACKLAKHTPPMSALEEGRYPYLDQNLIEFVNCPYRPVSCCVRRVTLAYAAVRYSQHLVPEEILSRSTKQVWVRARMSLCWINIGMSFKASTRRLSAHASDTLTRFSC